MKCDECVWNHLEEQPSYCQDHPDPNNCDKFYSLDGLKLEKPINNEGEKNKEEKCLLCKQTKDKGLVCWWCGSK